MTLMLNQVAALFTLFTRINFINAKIDRFAFFTQANNSLSSALFSFAQVALECVFKFPSTFHHS